MSLAQQKGPREPPEIRSSDLFDSPLKEAMHRYFRSFVQFFFPAAYADIDWDEGFTSLDTELRQIAGKRGGAPMRSDSLFRVKRLSGGNQLVLIHTEVQTYRDPRLAERLFRYNYRSFDAQGLEVASFAILGDASPIWRPESYGWSVWGCEMSLRFPVVKLIDFAGREEELAASRNPFALLTRAYLATRATKGAGDRRRGQKLDIVRRLYELGYDAEDVRRLFNVIDEMMRLDHEQEIIFNHELEQLETENQMRYINSVERIERESGIRDLLTMQLLERFGQIPEWASQKLAAARARTLEQWGRRIFDAGSLEDLFA